MVEERRIVTVLFADVVGSTALAHDLDPEDIRALLARFYNIAREIVDAHGGRLEKFIGDAVMAVFGLPQAHDDDPDRALAAAGELCSRLRIDPLLAGRLPVRIGVSTGEVVATRDPAAADFLVTGDPVNTAARLQQAAEPWTVLCSERTAHSAERRFAFGFPQEIPAKGMPSGLRARVLSGKLPMESRAPLPLVGRDADLAHLELIARRTFTERRPFLISLIGSAGIGKTRLLEALVDLLPQIDRNVVVAIAQCLPYGQRLTYHPLHSLLVRLAHLPEGADAKTMRASIHAWVQALGIDPATRTGDFLAATVGAAEGDVADPADLFAAWRTTIVAVARRTPLLLVFEDLHWSSDSLLDLVEYVMRPAADVPMLMAALARPELLDRRPGWGGGRRNYVSLALDPLSDDATSRLVQHILGGRAPELVARIVRQAEGNPFYACEIARSVLDRGPALDDAASVERAPTTLPDTVHATVLARLDRLSQPERRVLEVGALLGRSFHPTDVAGLAPELSDVPRLVDGLVGKEFIRPADTDRVSFRHILIREVAYQTLTRAERARLHIAVGERLESAAAGREENLAELIAYHYREAAATATPQTFDPDEMRRIRSRTVDWLCRAGEFDAGNAALTEASRHFQAAINLAEPERLPYIYERLGDVSPRDAGVKAYRSALRLCRTQTCGPMAELRILGSLLRLCMRWQGAVETRPSEEEITQLRRDGRILLAHATDDRAAAAFLIADAFFPYWQLHDVTPALLAEAEVSAQEGLELARKVEDLSLQSVALDALGGVALAQGKWERVHSFAKQRLAFGDRVDLAERLDARNMLAWAGAILGRLGEAEAAALDGLHLLQPGQLPDFALNIATWRVYVLTLLGRWSEALDAADLVYRSWVDSGSPPAGMMLRGFIPALDLARARADVGLIERYGGALRQVTAQFPRSTAFGLMGGYPDADAATLAADIIANFSVAHIRLELVERALSLCTDVLAPPHPDRVVPIIAAASSQGCRVLEAQARRALGVGQRDADELTVALELFEQTGAVPYAARTRCERALLVGDDTELRVSLQVLAHLGDVVQIGRLEAPRS